ncbi:AAA family ATPase [Galbitalea sp. SE-J8]|uniref:DEAD/DEAH box helicase n=1 Tax=Galbitalea sp. SE-J8 TaxID=3054952 RepID=UPI00259D07DC|nr:AAA family ATPase [Galbitalea sp. SE-J8]MDM4762006.1 AAA family ATPase [Galbitalea sp. SE-J8]
MHAKPLTDDERAPEHGGEQLGARQLGAQQLSAVTPGDDADVTRMSWRAQLGAIGGRSALLHFVDTPRTRIELSATHPGGLAQFITGRTTLLSNLIRDDLALRTAKVAAGLIAAKGLELATTRGIDAAHLGIGIAEWQYGDDDHRAPILLRPLAIRRAGRDFEVKLRGGAFLNPELARALAAQFGIELDPHAFAALADDDGSFKPNQVIDRLRGLTSHLEWFNVQPRLVVSTFADVAPALRADVASLDHPVLDAVAGSVPAQWSVKEGYAPVQAEGADARSPQTDVLLLDADAEQENVIAQIAAGNSVVVKTLPGTGGTQTIVNAVGALVGQNKRVLVVSARRASLTGLAERLADIGLGGVAVAPRTLRRDLIRSITRNERARRPDTSEVDEALLRLRNVLVGYRGALAKSDPALGVSVLDCVTELSRLALLPTPPTTASRLSRKAIEALAHDRASAAGTMVAAANLGEFRYGPGDSPWYGAQFRTSDEALRAHDLAKRLWNEDVPRLVERANAVIGTTRMRPYGSIRELGVYLRLLVDVRDSLDRFTPAVFDRSINELIVATSPRRDSPEMSSANRRRLKKLAREYVRPGVHVSDLNEALTRIQQQRSLWQRFAMDGVPPEVPVGIADLQVAYQQVEQDLRSLDAPLAALGEDSLVTLAVDALLARLQDLAADSDALDNLQERTALMAELRDLDVDPLTRDLAIRHVPEHQVAAELELAWWTSALESLLDADRALLGADTTVLDRLEADFRLVDEAHAGGNAGLLAWQLAENWRIGIVDWRDEADLLKNLLRRPNVTPYDLQTTAPHLSRTIAPVWLASPYEVPAIPETMPFDAVILVDAGSTTIAENAAAIKRARQVVAFGDPVTQTPSAFRLAIDEPEVLAEEPEADDAGLAALHDDSALARLSGLLPTLALTRSYRPGGEDLAELVNRRFYGGRIESLPWAGSFLGHPSLSMDYVPDGTGMPDGYTGAVESTDAEVSRVVDLVLAHASQRPRESLMVITASALHAVRVQQAVLTAITHRPELGDFVIGDRAEPFAVMTIDQAVAESRDRVIFSIGFGRTPHGKVLSNFGVLGRPGGERLLAVAMTRARRSMSIVSCFRPDDIDDSRMSHGAIALAEILAEVTARFAADADPIPDDGDPMLVDLARRLEARGLRVALGHRGKLGLVAAHGGMCVAIETDGVLHSQTLRESLRLRPELLRRLGWHYVRVHSFELFNDPDAVARGIVTMLGADAHPLTEEIPVVASVG